MSAPETSLSLLEQVSGSNASHAWDRLVASYSSLLHAWFRTAGLQAADCDDLTQRVLEVLVRRLPTFEHNGRPAVSHIGTIKSSPADIDQTPVGRWAASIFLRPEGDSVPRWRGVDAQARDAVRSVDFDADRQRELHADRCRHESDRLGLR